MVALVAESAAEDLIGSLAAKPVVVTELDIRYLAQANVGPVRTSPGCWATARTIQ